ncbi:MAG: LacI family DNA-binding transcriptional regulator [Lachnospiraceae bacterium]|nr:LacI family DNA-binding transcriptional regulator [Lachnospiraceae bacterium]MDD4526265.1 LacI family DNA-binding transcriptional regulator [Lachnospiraceae bacterium]
MTLKEIADLAGVSTATVSYVINHSAPVSDKTRSKVEKIIKETGYHSNMLAKSLRRNESRLIGILVEDVTVAHTAYIIDGINEIAEKKKYNTILCNLRLLSKIGSRFDDISECQADIDNEINVLLSMQVDGIIYIGMHDRRINHIVKNSPIPVVYCYCYSDNEGSSVRYNNEQTAYQLTQMVINKGHRKIAVMNGLKTSEPASLRFKGFMRALEESGISIPDAYVATGNWKFDDARAAALKMLKIEKNNTADDRPTAIVAMNDEMAVGVYYAAEELGLRIPDDLSVTGFDHADVARYIYPSLTTAERPLQLMGYRALEMLIENISGENICQNNAIYPCTIINGESIRDLNNNPVKTNMGT